MGGVFHEGTCGCVLIHDPVESRGRTLCWDCSEEDVPCFHSRPWQNIDNEPRSSHNPLAFHHGILRHTMLFAGGDGYLFVAGVSEQWAKAWGDGPKNTAVASAAQSPSRLAFGLSRMHWNAVSCSLAARAGSLEALQWCRSNNCPWDAKTCSSAALGGYLELL